MYSRRPARSGPFAGGFGNLLGGSAPRDVIALLILAGATFALQAFTKGAALSLLLLSENVWRHGFLWQLATYAFVGPSYPSFWFLISLWMLYMFGRDVFAQVGRRGFWTILAWGIVGGAMVACLVQLLLGRAMGGPFPFAAMQGTNTLLVILVCAFATLHRNATIFLMMVLPIRALWFIPLEIALAFIGFLGSHDLASFLGTCAAIGITYSMLTPGGLRRISRESWLRLQRLWMQRQLDAARRRSNIRVVPNPPDDTVKKGPWVH